MNNKRKSIKELEKEIKKNPEDFNTACDLIEEYLRSDSKRDWEKGLKILAKYREKYSREPGFHRIASHAYMRLNDDRAEELAIEAAKAYADLKSDEDKSIALLYLGYVFGFYRNFDEAIRTTEEALQLSIKSSDSQIEIYCKNNLAFYYAEAEIWDKSDVAKEYAKYAYENKRIPAHADTLAYVIVKFATTADELNEAKDLLITARQMEGTQSEILDEHFSELKKKETELKTKEKRNRF